MHAFAVRSLPHRHDWGVFPELLYPKWEVAEVAVWKRYSCFLIKRSDLLIVGQLYVWNTVHDWILTLQAQTEAMQEGDESMWKISLQCSLCFHTRLV